MSARRETQAAPADEAARSRILTDLDTNLLVEAGAGSGKTTSLVGRMVALVERGTPVERIAAVTFTRKAANELRERFQLALESRVRGDAPNAESAERCEAALRQLDAAFLGTIHSFCGRLLRERPLEVGLDPSFEEVTEEDWTELQDEFWNRWLERAKRGDDPALRELAAVGVDPRALRKGFDKVVKYPDVAFPTGESVAPNARDCRTKLEELVTRAERMLPREEPEGGWDPLMALVRRLTVQSRIRDWGDVAAFCETLERMTISACKVTQKKWGADKETKAAAKALCEEFTEFVQGPAADVLRCWREHRYPVVMRFLGRAAAEFERERLATATLGFNDLLLLAAKLLRENAEARDQLGARWAHLLVDEFQDTDPVQAEVCLLLASPSSEGDDWRRVTPRPSAIFVVGDPKQSIYRFRRADIQVYELVKRRFASFGAVLALTHNFRSTKPIESLVNAHFAGVFPATGTPAQAPYSAMTTWKDVAPADGVYMYTVCPDRNAKEAIFREDAALLASWIAARIAKGERSAGDFLILTDQKAPIEHYARALSERNVAASTSGAPLPQERELRELLLVLRTLADPENAVLVAAALEGLFFGLSPADLHAGRRAGLHFSITHRPTDEESLCGRALRQLHEWWKVSQRHPADVLLERILDDTGLLFHAASQTLGDARAGALLHLVEALRASSVTGASAVTDATERLELLLRQEAADAPLRPGRSDAVRVMNLHRAKGLEATVVVLAAPYEGDGFEPTVYVRRDEQGATGAMVIEGDGLAIAQPPGWEKMAAEESLFERAEDDRLLYVATTRPMRELVVARCAKTTKAHGTEHLGWAWTPLAATLAKVGQPLELVATDAPGRNRVQRSADELREATENATRRLGLASVPTLRVATVTESVKEQRETARAYDLPKATSPGAAWGRAVHRAMEAVGRGRSGESLDVFLAAVAREEELDAERSAALPRLVAELTASERWTRLMANAPALELTIMSRTTEDGADLLTEGVIDAASRDADGWTLLDWKTDGVADAEWAKRVDQYERQVGTYGEMLTALTGAPAAGEIVRARLAEK
ncbi:MAG: UvrD-helicase domain-containing protein [Gemmatimonadaceae bacterium]|nr:UvrD-helicase domain-containing protein [Gemmatimonadaceae bacterium]NUQ93189.1 UvrD-helicase domain-containing protein [Gemmatimonadaceae bacterium]NUS97180.1 UvrD-helicase domain-containing protein [Gemmatimonadaceae bacterium]